LLNVYQNMLILCCLLSTCQLCTPCAPPVYFRFSLIVLYTFHCKSGILIACDIEQYTDSNTCKFFLHCNQKYNIFRPNTIVFHSKLLCLDCIYCTSDYTESTTGMICLKIIFFFYPKCQYVILESYQLHVHAFTLLEMCTGKFCVTVEQKHSTLQCREWHLYWKRLCKQFSPNLKM